MKPFSTTKKFGGKIYTYVATAHSPVAANHAKEELQEKGFFVRLVKCEGKRRNGIGWWRCHIYKRKR